MRTILRLASFFKPFWKMVVVSVLSGTATIVCGIGLLGSSAYLLSMAALQPSISILQVSIVGVRFFGLSRGIFRYLERLSSHAVNLRIVSALRAWFFEALEPLAPARLMEFGSGDVLDRAVGDIEILENFYVRVFAPLITAGLITFGMGIFIGSFEPQLGWMLVLGLLMSEVFLPFGLLFGLKKTGRELIGQRAEMSKLVVEFSQAMGELVILDQTSMQKIKILHAENNTGRSQMHLNNLNGLFNGLLVLVTGLTIWVMLQVGIPLVENGVLDGVDLAVVILASIASFETASPLITGSGLMEANLTAARRLFKLVDTRPAVEECSNPRSLPLQNRLEMSQVSFGYGMESQKVLQDFCLVIEPGKRIAIVGESGAGKTSVINLLLRFWQKSSGKILLGDVEIEELKIEDVRSRLSVVTNPGWIMWGSVRQNLLIASQNATDEQCFSALEKAGLAEWILKQAKGLDTLIGERGMTLSGGERQRLMVARMILQNAPIVLLDEPTDGLDAITEETVLETLFEVTQGKCSLWLMHRLRGIERMDEIIVLRDGRIIERGSFDSLIQRGGEFRKMMRLHEELLMED